MLSRASMQCRDKQRVDAVQPTSCGAISIGLASDEEDWDDKPHSRG